MKSIEILSINLKTIRKSKNLSQEKLGLKAGIERSYMSDIECMRRNPTLQVIEKLADALDVSVAYLLTNHGSK